HPMVRACRSGTQTTSPWSSSHRPDRPHPSSESASSTNDLSMSQPQVSKHLRVLSEVGLVRCRAEGRRRLYRLEPARLRPLQEWLTKYERALNDRLHSAESGAFA